MTPESRCRAPEDGRGANQTAFVSLGSNKGDSQLLVAKARQLLSDMPGVQLAAASSLYRTEPQDVAEQPFFINQVLRLDCDPVVTAESLLGHMQDIERTLGRDRASEVRYGPRFIDLDLLLFGNQRMETEYLTLPHPRMLSRAFVLVPLAEIAPDLCLPQGICIAEALTRIRFSLEGDVLFQHGAEHEQPAG